MVSLFLTDLASAQQLIWSTIFNIISLQRATGAQSTLVFLWFKFSRKLSFFISWTKEERQMILKCVPGSTSYESLSDRPPNAISGHFLYQLSHETESFWNFVSTNCVTNVLHRKETNRSWLFVEAIVKTIFKLYTLQLIYTSNKWETCFVEREYS